MLPKDIKQTLADVAPFGNLSARAIQLFERKATKQQLLEIRKLGALLDKAIVDDNAEACNRITTTIAKLVLTTKA